MLTTFKIGPHVGRVCYLTESGDNKFATVECPDEKVAVRFKSDRSLKVGDWVNFHGEARVDASNDSDASLAYYHKPHDGSNKEAWVFRQMTSVWTTHVAPPEFADSMKKAMLCLRRHLDSWEKNLELQSWEETLEALNSVSSLVKGQVEERKPAPIAAAQINDL